ncbi:uncharacterized protein LY89DRAFT_790120 [Mollisia scopiformis]|uniref:DNA polymerase delta subunit 3 n=1 Tax=Mollisia scopiformis TaxID=149040 RepID=A0A132B3Q0_MOLSC|nr:uncharacterized protein LY89DRAFT_790120 [Mollisia scopiformis]KUJ07035.1 hypothetical protein LY89DRAFT_790120 [Mollisia scopiformis]
MADYKTYLASSILTEDKIVSYRLLSRALKVNVNAAKEMLYEFHRQQNGKKPGTIHATYLISGTKQKEPEVANDAVEQDGEDTHMQSSPPFMSSSMPQPQETSDDSGVLSITLVREENLDEVRSQYEHITSIHVYSIGPHPLKDLQILSDITRQVREICADEDPLETASTYGTIINKNAKRREGKRPPPAPAPVAPVPAKAQPAKPKPAESKPEPPPKKEISSTAKDFFGKSNSKPKANPASNPSSKETTPNPPTLKRDSSSIFKSFAKAKPKLKREGTDSSVADSPALSPAEDSPMKGLSDDDEEETYVSPAPADMEIVNKSRKERKENEEKLRQMMEMDDEDEEEEIKEIEEPEAVEKEASVEKEVPPTVSGGRRRGRRRVMKKKTVKDEEGYLVTKEEPVWESFSEDEPAPMQKPKAHAPVASTKGKKAAGKAGQGSIMSFFGKK